MTYIASAEPGETARSTGRSCKWGGLSRWSAWEIGAMVAGFVVFWPLGLLAIFAKWKFGQMWKGSAQGAAPWAGLAMPDLSTWGWQAAAAGSGNAAFDAYKREQLKRLDEERRRLDEEQRAFRDFLDRLRRAKDQDEFDRFMAERRTTATS